MDLSLLSPMERLEISYSLLFSGAGYERIKLSQFDEYELFDAHRAFLSGEQMVTFTDPHGKLYALRPDVTLSVLKDAAYRPQESVKVYYKEDVFRMSKETHSFASARQLGVEMIEKEDPSDGIEVLKLAQEALMMLPADTVLVLSHLDLLDESAWFHGLPEEDRSVMLRLISRKNDSDLARFLSNRLCPEEMKEELMKALSISGKADDVEKKLSNVPETSVLSRSVKELIRLIRQLPQDEHHRIMIDFSLTGSLDYYNGLVFQGFAEGGRDYVLSGGRYDRLARRFMAKSAATCGAIGFALSMDELEPIVEVK